MLINLKGRLKARVSKLIHKNDQVNHQTIPQEYNNEHFVDAKNKCENQVNNSAFLQDLITMNNQQLQEMSSSSSSNESKENEINVNDSNNRNNLLNESNQERC